MVGMGTDRGGGIAVADRGGRTRMKSRLQTKPPPNLATINPGRKNIAITDLNRRINDLKMEGNNGTVKNQFTEIQQRLQPLGNQTVPRRDSNSTVSSYYGSMRSADMSRKSSLASQGSRLAVPATPGSFYDPISAGSSRRSSQMSSGVPPSPPSHLLAGQLQRLQSPNKVTANLVLQTQSVALQQTALQQSWIAENLTGTTSNSIENRRRSEPCHTLTDRKSPPPRPASVSLSPLKGTTGGSSELHPNQAVVLDEVGEGEMVENKLVIPDEMVHYLNQVADNHQNFGTTAMSWSDTAVPKPMASPSPTNLSQILHSPQQLNSPQSVTMSPGSAHMNQLMTSPMNQMIPSPASLNQMMPSPANANHSNGTMNQMMPSPVNLNQMIPSPSNPNHPNGTINITNGAVNQIMPSPVNLNQMMPSPSNANHANGTMGNMNQMMQSPVNLNQMIPSPSGINQSNSTMNHMMSSPGGFNQIMPPQSNFAPILSPVPSMNQMVPSPGSNNMTQIVQSPIRCHSQMMSPGMPSPNQQVMPQNCTIMTHNGQIVAMPNNIMPNNGHLMQNNGQNHCYNGSRNMNHCYNVQHGVQWDRPSCHQQMGNEHNCAGTNEYHCRTMGYNINGTTCTNHSYQCNGGNNNGFQNCPPKPNGYQCIGYPSNPAYTCLPNEPLPSPAMATPAPPEMINHPQQAQMSRPCSHYNNQCYQPNVNFSNRCLSNNQACNNCTNKCYHHQCGGAGGSEIQCKDISQSQMSPGVVPPPAPTANQTQPLGMRQDTYQRTLEYVQNCQSWVNSDMVSSSTHPLGTKGANEMGSNMVVNDMTSSLSSLLEENRYLQMIQ